MQNCFKRLSSHNGIALLGRGGGGPLCSLLLKTMLPAPRIPIGEPGRLLLGALASFTRPQAHQSHVSQLKPLSPGALSPLGHYAAGQTHSNAWWRAKRKTSPSYHQAGGGGGASSLMGRAHCLRRVIVMRLFEGNDCPVMGLSFGGLFTFNSSVFLQFEEASPKENLWVMWPQPQKPGLL